MWYVLTAYFITNSLHTAALLNPITQQEDMVKGAKTFLYGHFGGGKALFCYINLKATDSVWGGAKP